MSRCIFGMNKLKDRSFSYRYRSGAVPMKFAKVLSTVSFSIFLLLGLVFPAISQDVALGPPVIVYGSNEDANTRVPAPPMSKPQTPHGRYFRAVHPQFTVTYYGFTEEAKAAFQYAVNIWASLIRSPVTIRIDAHFKDLGEASFFGFGGIHLGSVRPWITRRADDKWYAHALADKLKGEDLGNGAEDMIAEFNSHKDAKWYFGRDGKTPSGKYDFVTVVLHELGHGLGFQGLGKSVGNTGTVRQKDGFPGIYDSFVVNGAGTRITTFPDPSTALQRQLTGGNLFWNGAEGVAAYGGTRPKLYAPKDWEEGSSYSHLDEKTFKPGNPNSLMTPVTDTKESIHHPGPITLGMLKDMGWTINNAPEVEPRCTYTLSQNSQDVLAVGGRLWVDVTTTSNCNWAATSNSDFLSVTPLSGTGSGTVTVTVNRNTGAARNGTLTIAGIRFTVEQASQSTPATQEVEPRCTYTLSQNSQDVLAVGGRLWVDVTTTSNCNWAATSNSDFLSVTPLSGTGSGTVTVTVNRNTGAARNGTLTIAGIRFTVEQASQSTPATQADLAIQCGVSKDTLTTGESFTLSATVNNNGPGNSDHIYISYYYSFILGPSTEDRVVRQRTVEVDPLASGESITKSIKLDAPSTPGTYYYGAWLGSTNDPNIHNNLATEVRVTVSSPTPDPPPDSPSIFDVCERTPQVRDAIVKTSRVRNCANVTEDHLDSITRLSLSRDGITTLQQKDFDELRSLERLYLDGNNLRTLPAGIFWYLTELKELYLASNQLATLEARIFARLSSLEYLSLDGNQLTTLQRKVFDNLDNLIELRLEENQLTTLEAEVFEDLSSLEELHLYGNQLTTLPVDVLNGLDSLTHLYLYENQLTTLPAGVFNGLNNLTDLDLEDNRLTTLPTDVFKGLASLEDLDLEGNPLTTIEVGAFNGLNHFTHLDLDGYSLTTIEVGAFNGLNNLTDLDLEDNHLTTLPIDVFKGLASLEELRLGGNQLTTLPPSVFDGLDNLTILDLGGNQLTTLPPSVFNGLDSLTILDLDGNQLTTLPPGVFNGLDSLTYLDLDGNQLTTLPVGVFDDVLDTLSDLDVDAALKATLNFRATTQDAAEGETVRVTVSLSRALPVAVRVPYTVGGTATVADYTNLQPPAELLFLAGETNKEIVFTLLEDADTAAETVELTLGDINEIKLRKSDGGGPDARPWPGVLLNPSQQRVYTVTVTATGEGVSRPMYWTGGDNNIRRSKLDGTQAQVLVVSDGNPVDIALDISGNKMYWTDRGDHLIQRANLDGSGVVSLVTNLGSPGGIALDVSGGKMYWTDSRTDKIQRANLNGSRVEDLVTGLDRPLRIALDVSGGKMYWTDRGTDKIQRANLNGSGVEDLVTGLDNPRGIALDISGGKMYWTDRGTDKIQRANLNGSGVEDLVTHINIGADDIELDVSGGKMYWADNSYDKIQRANLDGSQVEVLVTGGYPISIALAIIQEEVINRAPLAVGSISKQTLTVGGSVASVNVSSNFRDPDNDRLTYTAISDNTRVATVRVSGAMVTITPKSVGSATVTVTASDGTLTATQRIAVTVEAAPRVAHTLVKISGDNQQGAPGATLANPFIVEVRDANGNQFEGVPVTFAVTAGGGTLSTQTATTDANGQASTTLTLGPNVGTNNVEASVTGISASVRFTATAQVLVGDAVNIPDSNLRAAIEKALNKGSGASITPTEMETLTSLVAKNANISDLTGLEGATNLTSLNLANNTIVDISSLVANTGLGTGDRVDLSGNPLNNHSINTIIPTLEGRGVEVHFETASNQAPEPVGTVPAQTLTVGGSAASVNVSSNFRDPNNDGLTYTAASDNTRVATVSVSGATVTITPQRVGSATVTVTASDGTLTTTQHIAVTVEAAPRVAHTLVKISGDNQQGPPGEALLSPFIVEVRDTENRVLEGVDVTFSVTAGGGSVSERTVTTGPNGQASSRLTLGNNDGENTVRVSVEGVAQTVSFTAMGANEINIPDPNLRAKIEKVLNKRAGDPITAAEIATLTRLVAENSNIGDLTGLKFATNLQSLNLFDNNLTTLPTDVFEGLSKLTTLDLRRNPLKTIEAGAFNGLSSLTTLDLSLTRLLPRKGGQLTTIEAGAFRGLTNLTTLDLEDNNLTTLPTGVFEGLSKLTTLDLRRNPLKTIKAGAFNGLSSLTTLDLSLSRLLPLKGGQLTTIEAGAFKGLSKLTTLDLFDNNLTTLPTDVFEGLSKLTTLDLRRNPGAPFTLTLELARTDTTGLATPGRATVVVKLAQGAPFEMTVNLSVEDGTLSATTATIARGKTESDPITVTQNGAGSTTVSMRTAPRVPSGYSGIRMAVGDSLVLFGTGPNRAPLVVGSIPVQTLTVGDSAVSVNISSNFRDPNNDRLTYTATSDNTEVATVNVSGAVVTITPKLVGSATVTVTASDGTLTATQRIAVTVEAAPRVAHTLEKISGDNQQGPPGEELLSPFTVEVRDAENRGLEGIGVTFTVTAGGGSLSETTVTTGPNGQASSKLTLGNNDGENTVRVSAEGVSQTVSFTAVGANEIDIPDRYLRAKIERALNKRAGDPITAAEMATLTRLDASNSRISDLTGLKFATNLTWLSLINNSITVLPAGVFAGLSQVISLDLRGNRLTTIKTGAFNGLSSLTKLDLRYITGHRGYLKTIEPGAFKGLSNLTSLSLVDNKLATLSTDTFEGLSQVISLALRGNQLITIKTGAFNGLSSLTKLDLRYITGHRGYLKTIEPGAFKKLSNLTSLSLVDNKLATLSTDTFEGLAKVTSLALRGNQLITIKTGAFNGLSSLTKLDLRYITGHRGYLKTIEPGAFKKLSNLTSLSLVDNRLTTLSTDTFEGLAKVTSLDLRGNQLTTIKTGAFNGLSSLTKLDLRYITGHRGYLKTIEPGAFKGLSNLTSLSLVDNKLATLSTDTFEGLAKVTSLDLRGNQLITIKTGAFNGLSSLTKLDLRYITGHRGYLKTIEPGAFKKLSNLTSLSLIDNRLTTLSTGTFEGLASLQTLDLRGNPGAPFTLVVELVRTDTTDPAAPGPATVVLQLVQGAPFEMTVNLSVEGGTLSATTAAIARGKIQSEPITLTQSGIRPATVSLETVPRVPGGYSGIRMAVGNSLSTGFILPHSLEIISGDNQQGPTGATLEAPLIVEVRDATDRGLEGVDVTFAVTGGDGSLSDTTVTTGPNGQAESWFTLGRQPGTHTIQASVEGLSQIAVFNAVIESMEFDFSVPAGINLIHVPLRVTAVDGVAQTIESISDLYNALGGASTVNFLLTNDPATQGWLSYFGASDTGTSADKVLTDDTGILAGMRVPVSVRLRGNALGINRSSTITLNQGLNVVGLPLRDSRIVRVSDLLALEGIGGNVPVVILTDKGEFKIVGQAGDASDVSITGGQAFILTAQEPATVAISGDGWTNTSGTAAAPPIGNADLHSPITGVKVTDTTPVLGLRGSIIDEQTNTNGTGFRVTVKNLSTGRTVAAVTAPDEAGYRLTVVDIETGRAAQIGDILEISARSPNPFIGVQPLRYTITAEDVKRSRIQLPELVAYEIPAEPQLLPNYPNPFNPETWIPYRLAEDAFVTLAIYDGSGRVIRTLEVGHRVAAVYESRSKAIYWDGRNEFGERVASGVYFYHLSAGDYSATKRMVIVK